jgi:hypothetical protein
MWNLCKFKDVAGKPGTGIHSTRLFGMAAFDLIGTIAIAVAIWVLTGWSWRGFLAIVAGLFILAILFHWLFCVDTALNRNLLSCVRLWHPQAKA